MVFTSLSHDDDTDKSGEKRKRRRIAVMPVTPGVMFLQSVNHIAEMGCIIFHDGALPMILTTSGLINMLVAARCCIPRRK